MICFKYINYIYIHILREGRIDDDKLHFFLYPLTYVIKYNFKTHSTFTKYKFH